MEPLALENPTCILYWQVRPVGHPVLDGIDDFILGAGQEGAPGCADGVVADAAIHVDNRALLHIGPRDLNDMIGLCWGQEVMIQVCPWFPGKQLNPGLHGGKQAQVCRSLSLANCKALAQSWAAWGCGKTRRRCVTTVVGKLHGSSTYGRNHHIL